MNHLGIVHIVGVDLERAGDRIGLASHMLQNCAAIVGTNRFLHQLPGSENLPAGCELIPITPLTNALGVIDHTIRKGADVVVLASGDPLFFGIARKIIQLVGGANTRIQPAVSSIQLAFSRFGIPWDDAKLLSLHGRAPKNYLGKILSSAKTAILTDGTNRAEVIAGELCSFLGDEQGLFTLHVAEDIGLETERLVTGTPEEIRLESFGALSVVIVVRAEEGCESLDGTDFPYTLGLKEQDIVHSRGLITKHEIRAAALHLLQIPVQSIVWDVGAGSGSVGLEAARMHRGTLVYSIEKNPEQHANILANKKKFSLFNLKLIKGDAPESLHGLPKPDRVFIGGSGGNLSDIIAFCEEALTENGVMIVTAVLDKTRKQAPELMYTCGLQVEMHTIAVTRESYRGDTATTLNPITIIVGRKQARKEYTSD